MKIGIDGNEANIQNRVGIGEYAYELLLQFGQLASNNLQFTIYLKDKPLLDMPKENDNWKYRIVRPHKFWTQIGLPLDLFFHFPRPNVFFTPSHYAPRFSPVNTAISIMDLSYIHYPALFRKKDLYQLVNWTKYSARKARRIFTISLASKNDIIRGYKLKPDRVVVTYPGIKQVSSSKYQVASMDSYILFVGTLQPRKNISKLIEALSLLKNRNIKLYIVGKKGWLYEEILNAPSKFGVEDRVRFMDYVKNEEMPSLYKNALCFVLPSLYEGFGLPVLEAMKYGCPVVLSNISSLPEAGGDAALYVDPENPKDIAQKLDRIISDSKLRSEMIKKGNQQVKKFSWEKTAKETLKVLEEIANER